MMRCIAQALFRVFAVVSLNLCNVLISNRSSVYLTGNNSLWSVIYPKSTDMFMACTLKYTELQICISVFSEGKIKSYLSVKR